MFEAVTGSRIRHFEGDRQLRRADSCLAKQLPAGRFGYCHHGRMLNLSFHGDRVKPLMHGVYPANHADAILLHDLFFDGSRGREQADARLTECLSKALSSNSPRMAGRIPCVSNHRSRFRRNEVLSVGSRNARHATKAETLSN